MTELLQELCELQIENEKAVRKAMASCHPLMSDG